MHERRYGGDHDQHDRRQCIDFQGPVGFEIAGRDPPHDTHRAWRLTTEPFAAEQIEYHPYLEQGKMLAALRRHNMAIIAYCPIALGRVIGDPVIEDIAATHGRSAAQVALRWIVQQPDLVAIPRTSKVERLPENLAVFDFALTDAEMGRIGALTRPGSRLVNEPQWVPEWD